MPLHLIYGPPNSGRAGEVRHRFTESLGRDPVLVVPTADDVYGFERELSQAGPTLGGAVMTFSGLFRTVATAGGAPPVAEMTPAKRQRVITVAVAERRKALGPLRGSADRLGFAPAFASLLDELQGAGLRSKDVESAATRPPGSRYLSDVASLFEAYEEIRDRLGLVDSHATASAAITLLRDSGSFWRERPVFLYGLDDLTPNQFELVGALVPVTDITIALPYEEGNIALAARESLLQKLRGIGVASELPTAPDPSNTADPLLFHLERNFGAPEPERRPLADGLVVMRSAGERGEAKAIATEVAKLVAEGIEPSEIVVVLRDPARRGPAVVSILEAYGLPAALEAEVPVTGTSVGGTLVALLEMEFGSRKASDVLRYMRGPSGLPTEQVDAFEGTVRRTRMQHAGQALKLWKQQNRELPSDLVRIRDTASKPAALATEVARLAATIASRPLSGNGDGPEPTRHDALELRAAAAIASALTDLAGLGQLAPRRDDLIRTIQGLRFRAWSGPVEGRVRIADPYRLRAARFGYVLVGSLQDGEFPRRDGGGDPFLSDAQRQALGIEPRRDIDAEERYLFHACLALPRTRLYLSYRDSDENGVAESRSPLLDDVHRLLEPLPNIELEDQVAAVARGRDLAQIVHPVAEAPSEDELARAIAAHGPSADTASLLAAGQVPDDTARRVTARIDAARAAEATTRAPGPLSNSKAIESFATVNAYGGTTLETFDLCSYFWFVSRELRPQPFGPEPEPLVQGRLMHTVLDHLYRDHPGGDSMPRPGSLAIWLERGRELLTRIATKQGFGNHPAERTIVRRVDVLLARFIAEEAARDTGGFEPWLLEARFGARASDKPVLDVDGWALHGAIDRVDRAPDGRALVIDYKLAREVTARSKLEEQGRLQLQLYQLVLERHWGAQPVGGFYHPLRGTSERRPRGAVLDEVAGDLAGYRLYDNDVVDRAAFEELLADARRRASEIVTRMRRGDIRRDPGPRQGLRGHDICPTFCEYAQVCRRDRAPSGTPPNVEGEEQ
jgi:ATP-dependent helicase/DNAse subunit B